MSDKLNVPAEIEQVLNNFAFDAPLESITKAEAALLSLLEQVGKEIIGDFTIDTDVSGRDYISLRDGTKDYDVHRFLVWNWAAQRQRLATLLKGGEQ